MFPSKPKIPTTEQKDDNGNDDDDNHIDVNKQSKTLVHCRMIFNRKYSETKWVWKVQDVASSGFHRSMLQSTFKTVCSWRAILLKLKVGENKQATQTTWLQTQIYWFIFVSPVDIVNKQTNKQTNEKTKKRASNQKRVADNMVRNSDQTEAHSYEPQYSVDHNMWYSLNVLPWSPWFSDLVTPWSLVMVAISSRSVSTG